MTTITFKNANAHGVFHSMCEGMWEVKRDDHVSASGDEGPEARALAKLIEATPWEEGKVYPLSFTLPGACVSAARDVLENCEDNRENWETDLDDDDPENPERDFIVTGEVVIEGKDGSVSTVGAVDCATAIMSAIEAIERAYCVEGVPEEFQGTIKTLQAILAQRGCDHFGEGDLLTELMDVVIFG